jgi:hypothetical protein
LPLTLTMASCRSVFGWLLCCCVRSCACCLILLLLLLLFFECVDFVNFVDIVCSWPWR